MNKYEKKMTNNIFSLSDTEPVNNLCSVFICLAPKTFCTMFFYTCRLVLPNKAPLEKLEQRNQELWWKSCKRTADG